MIHIKLLIPYVLIKFLFLDFYQISFLILRWLIDYIVREAETMLTRVYPPRYDMINTEEYIICIWIYILVN